MTSPNRRIFLSRAAALTLLCATGSTQADEHSALRFGLTPVFLDDQIRLLRDWRNDLEQRLNRPVTFIQRGSYREIVELLRDQQLDLAWLCGYPYVRFQNSLQLLATPVYDGQPLYRSYLIVPHDDFATQSILDLQGKIHAFSDPDSFSGYLLPRYRIQESGRSADGFFERVVMTHAHRNVVQAVADHLVDGGSVDGYVWDMLERSTPHMTGLTRVVCRSPYFSFPPIVARATLATATQEALTSALVAMAQDTSGQDILKALGLDGFMRPEPGMYDDVRQVVRVMGASM